MHCKRHPNTELDESGLCPWCIHDDRLTACAQATQRLGEETLALAGKVELVNAPVKLRDAVDALRTAALQVRHFAGVWDSMLGHARRNHY